nr:CCA tRNA nucleotidyltransferase [Saccharibacillus sp. JS10]
MLTLEAGGYTACWVGGCVRDELIGRPVHDMDIATSATPQEVEKLFERTVPTGIEHGTITVVIDKIPFEVTTFRTESEYKDFRRPEEVTFVRSLDEDLQRRDFTINAIARLSDGSLVDPYEGQVDLQRKKIRSVGDARERFREDALRMLRGVRFASVFAFEWEKSTWEALLELRGNMAYIAAERIRVELEKMIAGAQPTFGIKMLADSNLLATSKINWTTTQLQHPMMQLLDRLPAQPAELRWAALLQAFGVPGEQAEALMKSWTFSGSFAKSVSVLIRIDEAMNKVNESDDAQLRLTLVRCVLDHGRESVKLWIQYRDHLQATTDDSADLIRQASTWLKWIPVDTPRDLALSGNDIVAALKRKPGAWLGIYIRRLLESVALGHVQNERADLLKALEEIDANFAKDDSR